MKISRAFLVKSKFSDLENRIFLSSINVDFSQMGKYIEKPFKSWRDLSITLILGDF